MGTMLPTGPWRGNNGAHRELLPGSQAGNGCRGVGHRLESKGVLWAACSSGAQEIPGSGSPEPLCLALPGEPCGLETLAALHCLLHVVAVLPPWPLSGLLLARLAAGRLRPTVQPFSRSRAPLEAGHTRLPWPGRAFIDCHSPLVAGETEEPRGHGASGPRQCRVRGDRWNASVM